MEEVGKGFAPFFCAENEHEGAVVKEQLSIVGGKEAYGKDICDNV